MNIWLIILPVAISLVLVILLVLALKNCKKNRKNVPENKKKDSTNFDDLKFASPPNPKKRDDGLFEDPYLEQSDRQEDTGR